AKQCPEDADREEMALAGGPPAATVGREAARRDDAMDVRMKRELPRPGVEHRRDAELGPEPLRIVSEREEGLGRGAQQERKDLPPMRERERSERRRQGEDDVEVVDVEDARHALLDPPGLREALALRTVPIATRVVGGSFEAAARAHVEVAAEGRCPADGDRTEGLPLLTGERLLLAYRRPVGANDRRDVERRGSGPRGTAAGAHEARHDVPTRAVPTARSAARRAGSAPCRRAPERPARSGRSCAASGGRATPGSRGCRSPLRADGSQSSAGACAD